MILLRQRMYAKIPTNLIPKNKEQALAAINKGKMKFLESAANIEKYTATHTPGQLAEELGQRFVEAPAATAGITAGYASIPYIGPIPGTTAASLGLEAFLRKFKVYRKLIENLKGFYTDSPQEAVARAGTILVKVRDKVYRIALNPDFSQKMMLDEIKRKGIQSSERFAGQVGQVLPRQTKGITIKRVVRSAGDAIPALA